MKINVEELNKQPIYYDQWSGAAKKLIELGGDYKPYKPDNKTWTFSRRLNPPPHKHIRYCNIVLLYDGLLHHVDGSDWEIPKSDNAWYWEQVIEFVNDIYNACDKAGLLIAEE